MLISMRPEQVGCKSIILFIIMSNKLFLKIIIENMQMNKQHIKIKIHFKSAQNLNQSKCHFAP